MFVFIKLILLFGVSYLLYTQLSRVKIKDWDELELKHPIFLLLSCLLVVFNWFFEWKKWIITLDVIQTRISTKNKFRAFMAGIATGLITPNMLGNFIGRIYYFRRNQRPAIILLTQFSNFAQFFASLFFGFLSLLFLRETPFGINVFPLVFISTGILLLLLSMYLFFEKIKFPFLERKSLYSKMVAIIKKDDKLRIKFLFYSLLRHFIFTLQFWLMFNAFEDSLNLDTFFWIWQIFLWTTLIPSLWFGKLVIRESIALLVLGSAGFGQVEILTASVLIWVVNLAFPAVVSLFVCNQKKIDVE